MSEVSRKTLIGDLVRDHPEVAPIVSDFGLHCVGCHVAYWETLEQGCRGHGMSEERIDELITTIKDAIVQEAKSS